MITYPMLMNDKILMKCNSCKRKYRVNHSASKPCPKCGSDDVGRVLVDPLTFLA